MAADPDASRPIDDPTTAVPPDKLVDRIAFVQAKDPDGNAAINTIRLPNDPRHPEKDRWFASGTPSLIWYPERDTGNPMEPAREGNAVQFMIDGIDRSADENVQPGSQTVRTYRRMREAIQTATGPGHFIYMLNWFCSDDYLIDGITLNQLLKNAGGAEIRALFWQQKGLDVQTVLTFLGPILPALIGLAFIPVVGAAIDVVIASAVLAVLIVAFAKGNVLAQNQKTVNNINKLPTGGAILDNNTLNFGSHHQKVLVVNGSKGLIAFCGGIDFNPDRVAAKGEAPNDPGDTVGAPLHDVHTQVQGPAALDILKTFVERWKDHPDLSGLPTDRQALSGDALLGGSQPAVGEQVVQIGRTFGNGSRHSGIRGRSYGFARQGERTGSMVIAHAIQSAKRFVYIEDQYFSNAKLGDLLVQILPNVEHITILLPHGSISDQPDGRPHRHKILQKLQDAGKEKVRVFCRAKPLTPQQEATFAENVKNKKVDDFMKQCAKRNGRHFHAAVPHTYIHAKLVIVDDRFATVGSVNCNMRSWTHDSEIVAGVFDESHDDKMTLHFAHRLRIKLWAEHLRMDTPEGHAELWDGVASAVHWDRLPPLSRVVRYNKIDNTQPASEANEPLNSKADKERLHIPIPVLGFALDAALVKSEFFFNTFSDPDGS